MPKSDRKKPLHMTQVSNDDDSSKGTAATQKYHMTSVFDDQTSFRAKGLRRTRENRNVASVFGDRTSFRAKGLSRHTQNRNFT